MRRRSLISGFTLLELIFSLAIASLAGAAACYVLYTGLILFAKNTAVNVAHQSARRGILGMQKNIHEAVSIPQLVDANRVPVAGTGPAAGISFQLYADGPFQIANNQLAGGSSVQVLFPKNYVSKLSTPSAGQRLIIPSYGIETDITSVSGTVSNVTTLFINPVTSADLTVSNAGNKYNIPCFFTWKVTYVAVNGQLRYYGPNSGATGAYSIVSRNITSTAPFSTPLTASGTPKSRYVAAIDLSTSDPLNDKRGFKSANMFLKATVPCRAILTTFQ